MLKIAFRGVIVACVLCCFCNYGISQESVTINVEQKMDSAVKAGMSELEISLFLDDLGKQNINDFSYAKAQAAFLTSLQIREKLSHDSLITKSHLLLGQVAVHQNEFEKAFEHFYIARQMAIEDSDSMWLGHAYNNLGLAYTRVSNFDSSIVNFQKALLVKKDADVLTIARTVNNIGLAYEGIATVNKNIGEVDSAEAYFARALDYYRQAYKLRRENKLQYEIAQSLNNIGYVQYEFKKYDSASINLKNALKLALQHEEHVDLPQIYLNLFEVFFTTGANKDSTRYFLDQYLQLRDEMFDLEKNKEIQRMRIEYGMEKQERELAQKELALEKQRATNKLYTIIAITLFAILVGSIIFLIYRQRLIEQLRKKDEDIHSQHINEIIRTQEISVLSARVEGQDMERQRIAEDLHDRLGSKLAAVKLYYDAANENNNSETSTKARKLLDETIDETRKIAHNLASGVLTRFGLVAAIQNLKETLESSKKIEVEYIAHNFKNHQMSKDLEVNFYRIIQELISNILKHAGATQITIQLTRHDDGMITLMVEDNGKGFNPATTGLNSMGLQNLKSRVKRFDGVLTIDSEPGHGTTVIIEIEEKISPIPA